MLLLTQTEKLALRVQVRTTLCRMGQTCCRTQLQLDGRLAIPKHVLMVQKHYREVLVAPQRGLRLLLGNTPGITLRRIHRVKAERTLWVLENCWAVSASLEKVTTALSF